MKRREFITNGTLAVLGVAAATSTPLLHTAMAQENAVKLAGGEVTPQIIVSANATRSEHYAAQELAHYLGKIVNKTFRFTQNSASVAASPNNPVIVVGHHPMNNALAATLTNTEETIIDVTPGIVRLIGGRGPSTTAPAGKTYVDDRGTLYAVYEFLDNLGVRWYRPDPWGEHVPALETIAVPQGQHRSIPAFEYRFGIFEYRYEREQTREQAQTAQKWAVRNRQNVNLRENADHDMYGGSKSFWIPAETVHGIYFLQPREASFQAHPEHFALIDGQRNKMGQPCLGNTEFQRWLAAKIVASAQRNPQLEAVSIELRDADLWCQCALCKAMDDPNQHVRYQPWPEDSHKNWKWNHTMFPVEMTNRMNLFGNIVANMVDKDAPGTKIFWLAYTAHTEPPTRVDRIADNAFIVAAATTSVYFQYQHAYADYSRKLRDPSSQANTNFLQVLEGYKQRNAKLLTYEYWSGFAWQGPMPVVHTMTDRLREYQAMGVKGCLHEVHASWGPQGLMLYMYARLMWNPHLDVEKELDLYYKNYYGPAAGLMRQYHQRLETAATQTPFYPGGLGITDLLTHELMTELTPLVTRAKDMVQGLEPYEQRIWGVWAGNEYARLMALYKHYVKIGNPIEAGVHYHLARNFQNSFKDGTVFHNGIWYESAYYFNRFGKDISEADMAQAERTYLQRNYPKLLDGKPVPTT